MNAFDRQETDSAVPSQGLLILTGGSHTGKTSVVEAVLDSLPPPVAYLSVDGVLATTLVHPRDDPWANIPLAYELIALQMEALLARGWFVVAESTFTYVPESGLPEFHAHALARWVEIAKQLDVRSLVAQLLVDHELVGKRAKATGRLPVEVAKETARLHNTACLPANTLRLATSEATPSETALRIIAALRATNG